MKKPALALIVLLSLLPFAPSMAQMPAVTGPDLTPATEVNTDFLATLSDGQARTIDDQVPAPFFMSGCTDSSQCPTGHICCYLCGNPPAEGDDSFCRGCVTPEKGGFCPQVY